MKSNQKGGCAPGGAGVGRKSSESELPLPVEHKFEAAIGGLLSLSRWLTGFVSDITMAFAEDGARLGSRPSLKRV